MPRTPRRPARPRPATVAAAAVAALAVLLPGYAPVGAPGSAAVTGPVVVLGTSGLHWDDLDPSLSNLATLVGNGASASVVARQDDPRCPFDGWLTLTSLVRTQTINRAVADRTCLPMPAVTVDADHHATIDGWPTVMRDLTIRNAIPGQLQRSLGARATAAVGSGAVVALATAPGDAAGATRLSAWPGLPTDPDGGIDPAQTADDLAQQVQAAVDTHPALLVVDLGAVTGTLRSTGNDTSADPAATAAPAGRNDQLVALDDRIGQLLAVLPDSSTVLLASLADPAATSFDHPGPTAATLARSQVVVAVGPAPGGGRYRAGPARAGWASVDGVAHSDDVPATVLAALGLPVPDQAYVGSALAQGRAGTEDPVIERLDLDQAWRRLATVRPLLLTIGWGAWLVVVAGVLAMVRATRRQRPVQLRFVNAAVALGVFGGALPVASVLAGLWPWWHGPHVTATLVVALLTAAVVVGGTALAAPLLPGPGRRQPAAATAALGLVTAVVVLVDRLTGSGLAGVGVLDAGGVLAGGLGLVAVSLLVTWQPWWAARAAGRVLPRVLAVTSALLLAALTWWAATGDRMASLVWNRGAAWSSSIWPTYPWLTFGSTLLVLLPALAALAVRLSDRAGQADADAAADRVRRAGRG